MKKIILTIGATALLAISVQAKCNMDNQSNVALAECPYDNKHVQINKFEKHKYNNDSNVDYRNGNNVFHDNNESEEALSTGEIEYLRYMVNKDKIEGFRDDFRDEMRKDMREKMRENYINNSKQYMR